jgi:hypothetical protein
VNLGVHDHEPPASLAPFVESVQITYAGELLADGAEHEAVRIAFEVKKWIDRFPARTAWIP